MIQIGQTIVYRRAVCTVKAIVSNYRDGQDYYTLVPVYDTSLTIHAPVDGSSSICRPLLTKKQVEQLIGKISSIEEVTAGDRSPESTYKELFQSEKYEDLICIIKTAYLRSQLKLKDTPKRSEKDKAYFRLAEGALYGEFAAVLQKSFDETKSYMVDKVSVATV